MDIHKEQLWENKQSTPMFAFQRCPNKPQTKSKHPPFYPQTIFHRHFPSFCFRERNHPQNTPTMATLTVTPFSVRLCPSSTHPIRSHQTITTTVRLLPSTTKKFSSLKLFTSSHSISAGFFSSINPNNNRPPFSSLPSKPQSLTVHCHKGYKMKTHKVSLSPSQYIYVCLLVYQFVNFCLNFVYNFTFGRIGYYIYNKGPS